MTARFLVVDDDPGVAQNVARVVRPFGDVHIAGSVSTAKASLAAQGQWQGFIVDLCLPDGSGLDVVDVARTACPRAPAMVLTGYIEARFINAVHDLGATYVVKPVHMDRIERFCRDTVYESPRPRKSPPLARTRPANVSGCAERLRELLPLRLDPLVRHAIGTVIAGVKARPDLYGSAGVAAVAAAVGENCPSLYRHAAVAESWTEDELRALLSRRGRAGRRLSWSHFVALGAIASAEERERLVTRVLDEGLSVRQLAAIVMAGAGAVLGAGARTGQPSEIGTP